MKHACKKQAIRNIEKVTVNHSESKEDATSWWFGFEVKKQAKSRLSATRHVAEL